MKTILDNIKKSLKNLEFVEMAIKIKIWWSRYLIRYQKNKKLKKILKNWKVKKNTKKL